MIEYLSKEDLTVLSESIKSYVTKTAGTLSTIKYGDGNSSFTTDTTTKSVLIPIVSTTATGLMSPSLLTKLNGIAEGANKYVHPTYSAVSTDLYNIGRDATGHVVIGNKVTIPTSLPANGGNADTVDGKHATAFAAASHTHTKDQVGLGNVDNTADKNKSVASAVKATQDGNGKVIADTYETKVDATTKYNDLAAIANGRTKSYVIETSTTVTGTSNSKFASTADSIALEGTAIIANINGESVTVKDIPIGSNILIRDLNYPDRWVSGKDASTGKATFSSLESRKVDLSPYYTKTETDTKLKGYVTGLDLSNQLDYSYYNKDYIEANFVATEDGKGLSTCDFTTALKTKLDGIAAGANKYTYTLPKATSSALGGIKVGYTASGKNYPVALDTNGNAYVNVPWENTHQSLANYYTSAYIDGLIKNGVYTFDDPSDGIVLNAKEIVFRDMPWDENNPELNPEKTVKTSIYIQRNPTRNPVNHTITIADANNMRFKMANSVWTLRFREYEYNDIASTQNVTDSLSEAKDYTIERVNALANSMTPISTDYIQSLFK